MSAEQNQQSIEDPQLTEAQVNAAEAEQHLDITSLLLVDRLLAISGNNVEVVTDIMHNITNVAGKAAILAVALRRVQAIRYSSDNIDLHPDTFPSRSDSLQFGLEGAQPLEKAIEKIPERAVLATQTQEVKDPEYVIGETLQEMVDIVRGNPNKFLHLRVGFPKTEDTEDWQFTGDMVERIDIIIENIRLGKWIVVEQGAGSIED